MDAYDIRQGTGELLERLLSSYKLGVVIQVIPLYKSD